MEGTNIVDNVAVKDTVEGLLNIIRPVVEGLADDGKLDWSERGQIAVALAFNTQKVVEGVKNFIPAFLAMDEVQQAEVKSQFQTGFDLQNYFMEQMVEETFDLIVDIAPRVYQYVSRLNELNDLYKASK